MVLGGRMRTKVSEKEIQEEIKRMINESGQGFVYRQNTGCTKIGNRWVSFGKKGAADLTGLLQGGRRLEVEVKRPKEKQSPEQMEFQSQIETFGGLYLVVHSPEELIDSLGLGYLF